MMSRITTVEWLSRKKDGYVDDDGDGGTVGMKAEM